VPEFGGAHNVTPAYVSFGRKKAILRERKKIKKETIPFRDHAVDNPAGPMPRQNTTSKTSRIINIANEPEPPPF
jgi:hypothetical protein